MTFRCMILWREGSKAEEAKIVLPHYKDLQAFWDALAVIAP